MAKIDKVKKSFTYSGSPKSYWEIAARKNIRLLKGQKESEHSKELRKERDQKLKFHQGKIIEARRRAKKEFEKLRVERAREIATSSPLKGTVSKDLTATGRAPRNLINTTNGVGIWKDVQVKK